MLEIKTLYLGGQNLSGSDNGKGMGKKETMEREEKVMKNTDVQTYVTDDCKCEVCMLYDANI
jgi:hypothetical protein